MDKNGQVEEITLLRAFASTKASNRFETILEEAFPSLANRYIEQKTKYKNLTEEEKKQFDSIINLLTRIEMVGNVNKFISQFRNGETPEYDNAKFTEADKKVKVAVLRSRANRQYYKKLQYLSGYIRQAVQICCLTCEDTKESQNVIIKHIEDLIGENMIKVRKLDFLETLTNLEFLVSCFSLPA